MYCMNMVDMKIAATPPMVERAVTPIHSLAPTASGFFTLFFLISITLPYVM